MKKRILRLAVKSVRSLLNLSHKKFDKITMELYKELFREEYPANQHKKIEQVNYYSSFTPDRYSHKFGEYQQQTNFLEFKDLEKWMAGNYDNNIGDIGRFYFLNLCIDSLLEENIAGNVAEIGVYKGNSAYLLAKYARHPAVNSNCYLFDTFEGFDAKDIQGIDSVINQHQFTDTSLEYVQKNVGTDKNIVYVKGYFPESLKQVGDLDSFSLVHIDCDLEKPIADSLNYFYPRMKKGGFLIMHDYSSLVWKGAKVAIDAFFKDKPEFVIPIPDKSGTCVIRKV
ncbi:hypothetical protein A3860_35585 [Niastella vici]|uniref:Methyltransferase n=1 Tax=Niastella vici TaxID=1703345 RepID=A0A1V9FNT6_9BACT|nr:TylF/MycF/NovP-related O-methyltransferase [Niastella vici]OQP59967.1 hypothetical protein A3860_35585 [Niastella vici]